MAIHFKAVFDFANFIQCGQDPWDAYSVMKPYIEYIHVKDARKADGVIVPAGKGDGKIQEILKDLFEHGYKGFISLEPHLTEFDGLKKSGKRWRKLKGHAADGWGRGLHRCLRSFKKDP